MTYATISPHQLAESLASESAIDLIDVRTPVEFRDAHVTGARNIPLDRLDAANLAEFTNWSGDRPLYVICQSGSRGGRACEKLLKLGFGEVVNIEGGTAACVEAGLPIIRGKKSVSIERQVLIAAGSLVLLGVLLGWLVHPALFGLSAVIGAGLVIAGVTDTCGMGMLLTRAPWNRVAESSKSCSAR